MTGDKSWFKSPSPKEKGSITYGDIDKGRTIGFENVGMSHNPTIEHIIFINCLKHNLLSISQVCDKGSLVIFE